MAIEAGAREPLLSIKASGACSAGSSMTRLIGEGFQQGLWQAQGLAISMAE